MAGPPTLLASALLAIVTGVGFAVIGALVARRRGARQGSAATMFGLFWFSAATIWITQGLGSLAGWMGVASLPLLQALDEVSSPAYCLAAASLLYYVAYLLTGRAVLLAPILLYYLAVDLAIRWRVALSRRLGVDVQAWQVVFEYETPLQGPAYTLLVALLALPLLGAILAYGSLWFRVKEAAVRYRVALVTLGLLAWVLTEALAATSGITNTAAGELLRRVVALGSTVVLFLAFRPPAWARERWGAQAAF